jgi:3-phosphoshikimate 1-carboxyvinyltransferase
MKISYHGNYLQQIEVDLPSSKSITNRLYILEFLLKTKLNIIHASHAFDSEHLKNLVRNNKSNVWNVGPTGTSFRFLASALSIIPGNHILTGDDRIKERPIAPLIDALNQLGIPTKYLEKENFAPVLIQGNNWKKKSVEIDASMSGQFVSALMLTAPFQFNEFEIVFKNNLISSKSYIHLTAKVLEDFGLKTTFTYDRLIISGKLTIPSSVVVESDWSSAAFWMQYCLLSRKEVYLKNLHFSGLQGEEKAVGCFVGMGLKVEERSEGILIQYNTYEQNKIETLVFDFSDCPDAFPASFLTALLLNIPLKFSGLHTLNHKESPRLTILIEAAKTLGYNVVYNSGVLTTLSREKQHFDKFILDAKNDHRLIMAASMAAVCIKNVEILNAKGIEKSYPSFFEKIKSIGFQLFND